MSLLGGRLWIRGAALVLAVAGTAAGLSGCEYEDVGADPTPARTGTSRPAPPSPLPAGTELAGAERRNLDRLGSLLGARPDNIVLEGAGGLGGAGFRKSVKALEKGTYTVTAACVGAPTANISISQDGLRDGGRLELTLDCGKATTVLVDIAAGPVQAQGFSPATGPGTGEVAGFWMLPAAAGS
jgi:hypothetical protein